MDWSRLAIPLAIRQLNYRPLVFVDLIGRLIPVPVMIGFALLFPSVWTLAVGTLLGGVLRVVLSHTIVPGPRMAWRWQKAHFKEFIHFGRWITISSIATFVASQSDVILFGLLFPSTFVGVYFIARTLVDAAEGLLEKINGSLTLPVLSEVIRQDPQNLRNRYYRFRLPIEIFALSCGGFLFVAGGRIISILYDARYAEAGPILELLGLGLAIYPIQVIRSAFTAIGETYVAAIVSIVQAISLVCCLLTGFFMFGALGAVAGIALSRLIPSAVIIWLAHGRGWIGTLNELRLVPLFLFGVLLGKLFMLVPGLPFH